VLIDMYSGIQDAPSSSLYRTVVAGHVLERLTSARAFGLLNPMMIWYVYGDARS
jgi:hypothetical protein